MTTDQHPAPTTNQEHKMTSTSTSTGGYSLSDLHTLGSNPLENVSAVPIEKPKLVESPFGEGRFASPGLGLIGEFPFARAQTPHTVDVNADQQWEIVRNPFGDGLNYFLGATIHVLTTDTSSSAYTYTLADILGAVAFAEKQAERHLGEMVTGLPADMRQAFLESVLTVVRRKRHLAGQQEAAIEVTRQQYAEYLDRSEAALVSAQKATKVACSAVYAVNKLAAKKEPHPQRSLAEPIAPYGVLSGVLFRGTNKAGDPHAFSVPRRPVGSGRFPYLLLSHHGDKYPHTDWVGWESVLDRVRVEFGSLDNVEKVEAL